MGSKGSVLVAMSGGVDSSVAACLLHEAGYEVVGSHLKLVDTRGVEHGCCGPKAERDAAAVAARVGFAFEVAHLEDVFEERVIGDYLAEAAAGRTPNPCIRCNEHIKFGAFLRRADALGIDYVASGHYVRSARDPNGRWRLYRGVDRAKDQSYALHTLGQHQLARSSFPVGGQTKEETRAHARRFGLPVAEKPDSQELCFVPFGDAAAFLASRAPDLLSEGDVVDPSGRVVGTHRGAPRYTVGQRRGLGVSLGERSYVVEIDAGANRVVVGASVLLARRGLEADRVSWVGGRPPRPFEGEVQIRSNAESVPAVVTPRGRARARVEFRRPQRAVAPGQSAVFYADDEVLGGGRIRSASR